MCGGGRPRLREAEVLAHSSRRPRAAAAPGCFRGSAHSPGPRDSRGDGNAPRAGKGVNQRLEPLLPKRDVAVSHSGEVGAGTIERASFCAKLRLVSGDLYVVMKNFLYKPKELRSAIVRSTQVQTSSLGAPYRGTFAAAASASRCNRCKVAIARRSRSRAGDNATGSGVNHRLGWVARQNLSRRMSLALHSIALEIPRRGTVAIKRIRPVR